jgi:trimeric autotransporter adhesin
MKNSFSCPNLLALLAVCFHFLATCAVPASPGAEAAGVLTNGIARPSMPRLATGRDNLLVVKTDGSLWSMGSNVHGAVGDGTTNNRPHLVRLGTENDWADASCGDRFALTLKNDGTVWAWGENDKGQLGDGTRQDRSRPVRVGEDHDWVRIAAGPTYSLALKSDGTAWAWGQSDFSGWGRGDAYLPKTVPTRLWRGSNWTAIATTPQHTLQLSRDGISWIWMHGGLLGALYGAGPGELRMALGASFYFLHANSPTRFSLSPTNDWSVGLGEDGNIWLKGHNHAGEQTPPDWIWTAPDAAPTTNSGEGTYWKMIRIGTDHVVSVKSDGSLWAWGTNYFGQIGDGTTKVSAVPVRVGQANDWVWASAGGAYSAGLKADGSLWMWGRRIGGQNTPLASTKFPPPGTTDLLPVKIADLGPIANDKIKPAAAPKAGAKGPP